MQTKMAGSCDQKEKGYVRKRVRRMVVGRRKRGRPKRRWEDCIREDMEAAGVNFSGRCLHQNHVYLQGWPLLPLCYLSDMGRSLLIRSFPFLYLIAALDTVAASQTANFATL